MLATLAVLRPAHPEVTFGTKTPDSFDGGDAPPTPYAMVRTDNTAMRYPVAATSTVRVTVWAESEAAGVALAFRILATLLDYPGGPAVRSFGHYTGPLPTTDPDNGRPVASITVGARLRPISI
ncbi:hypothetical protein [Micromonospora sp. WMMD980]|uniref:hypothetical protein n=1 Tax=Micromonospora sp. WMMD980 TaxID=3016088 RepID=UPI0024179900|nr:hypothetical protein [Micromonospora sp. WMMD980]MDG4801719.1 hypothetical protein [Micromonospora sp. WMMD980]